MAACFQQHPEQVGTGHKNKWGGEKSTCRPQMTCFFCGKFGWVRAIETSISDSFNWELNFLENMEDTYPHRAAWQYIWGLSAASENWRPGWSSSLLKKQTKKTEKQLEVKEEQKDTEEKILYLWHYLQVNQRTHYPNIFFYPIPFIWWTPQLALLISHTVEAHLARLCWTGSDYRTRDQTWIQQLQKTMLIPTHYCTVSFIWLYVLKHFPSISC